MNDLKRKIRSALTTSNDSFLEKSKELLEILGYKSNRTLSLSGRIDDFIKEFPARNQNTKTECEFSKHAESIHFIFQLTSEEIVMSTSSNNNHHRGEFDEGDESSFLFFAVELKSEAYSRGKYAEFTREVNKRLMAPTVILFKAGEHLTLAFVHRREHRYDPNRPVLGNVSLLREVAQSPHRAHLDILSELSLPNLLLWMKKTNKSHNFDGLLKAWLNKLDAEELNRRFYEELFNWFERAQTEAKFPEDKNKLLNSQEHVIRLITRILFIWFIKEKGLVSEELFNEYEISKLLKNYDRENGDSYYRAMLQNLFFATLNTETENRGFKKQGGKDRTFSRYLYKNEISDREELKTLFSRTPFINGGLFDCLDSEESAQNGSYQIDCFSDNENLYKKLSFPNRLFFNEESGLFPLLNRYKFTVEENTPIEQEVALDPELLGKVFENLLAAYNPETHETARKKTGSYYTPRAIVDYMVDEALVEALLHKCCSKNSNAKSKSWWQDRLRYLLDYADEFNDAKELFEEDEVRNIVEAISEISILDPAVGSGAFLMGALHKLTLALRRIDPSNEHWRKLQEKYAQERLKTVFDNENEKLRREKLLGVNETFERYSDSDLGRKLYLIQNNIFGVDIQPIACQIAKLRFFISLAIEQQPNSDSKENFGIKPLPNLETRFIVADTLKNLKVSGYQYNLFRQGIELLKDRLDENRRQHFLATTISQKNACKVEDKQLRCELKKQLNSAGLEEDYTNKIAQWDPYDQNAKADWFDAEYMFGKLGGFDIVIGNPPYIPLQKDGGKLRKRYEDNSFETFASSGDIYQLFYEKACCLLNQEKGVLSYITSNSWLRADYGKHLRSYLVRTHTPLKLLELGKDIFENAIVDTNILVLRDGKSKQICKGVDMDRLRNKEFPPDDKCLHQVFLEEEKPWGILSPVERNIRKKMEELGTPLKEWDISINYGIKTGYNDAFIINNETKEELIRQDPKSAELIKPVLKGKDIQKYKNNWKKTNRWLIATFPALKIDIDLYPAVKRHLLSFGKERLEQTGMKFPKSRKKTIHAWYELQDTCAYHEEFSKNKITWKRIGSDLRFAYCDEAILCIDSVCIATGKSLKTLTAILNSRIARYQLFSYAPKTGTGDLLISVQALEPFLAPLPTKNQEEKIEEIFQTILQAKFSNQRADISDMEVQIDQLTYELYDLTQKEISFIERIELA